MKKIALWLLLLLLMSGLVGCAAVTNENSFQNQASGTMTVPQATQMADTALTPQQTGEPVSTTMPTETPKPGYNG